MSVQNRTAWVVAALLGGSVLALVGPEILNAPEHHVMRIRRELQSDDPAVRRAAAWRVADEKLWRTAARIAATLAQESDPTVREAYAYALGRLGDPRNFDAVASLIASDPEAYVRHAAWLAVERMDATRFRELAARTPPRPETWDRLGLAYAWAELGDLRGVDTLLEITVDGDAGQRRVASQALYRHVAPILEAAGAWPLNVVITENETWTPALVADVRKRLGWIDAARGARELHAQAEMIQRVRYVAGKLYIARERIAWLLGAPARR